MIPDDMREQVEKAVAEGDENLLPEAFQEVWHVHTGCIYNGAGNLVAPTCPVHVLPDGCEMEDLIEVFFRLKVNKR